MILVPGLAPSMVYRVSVCNFSGSGHLQPRIEASWDPDHMSNGVSRRRAAEPSGFCLSSMFLGDFRETPLVWGTRSRLPWREAIDTPVRTAISSILLTCSPELPANWIF